MIISTKSEDHAIDYWFLVKLNQKYQSNKKRNNINQFVKYQGKALDLRVYQLRNLKHKSIDVKVRINI